MFHRCRPARGQGRAEATCGGGGSSHASQKGRARQKGHATASMFFATRGAAARTTMLALLRPGCQGRTGGPSRAPRPGRATRDRAAMSRGRAGRRRPAELAPSRRRPPPGAAGPSAMGRGGSPGRDRRRRHRYSRRGPGSSRAARTGSPGALQRPGGRRHGVAAGFGGLLRPDQGHVHGPADGGQDLARCRTGQDHHGAGVASHRLDASRPGALSPWPGRGTWARLAPNVLRPGRRVRAPAADRGQYAREQDADAVVIEALLRIPDQDYEDSDAVVIEIIEV